MDGRTADNQVVDEQARALALADASVPSLTYKDTRSLLLSWVATAHMSFVLSFTQKAGGQYSRDRFVEDLYVEQVANMNASGCYISRGHAKSKLL